MSRSISKGPFVDYFLLKKIRNKIKVNDLNKPIKIWSRRSVILPEMVGFTFNVHNGKKFISVYVTDTIVGHKFGEFSMTRYFSGHVKKEKNITNKKS